MENQFIAEIDKAGRLVFSPDAAACFGLTPGMQLTLTEGLNGLHLLRPVTHLAKVYIEPTNQCNLNCRICMRNIWDEPQGQMSPEIFARIIDGLAQLPSRPTVFFGGFGEPLSHPAIVEMVSQAKMVAGAVELITNGTLLSRDISRQLIEVGLDRLWVSIDGATPGHYADVRLGAQLSQVIDNISAFRDERRSAVSPGPEIGIAFVAMRRNIQDLPELLRLSARLEVSHFMVTNVLAYTENMCQEALYYRSLNKLARQPSPWSLQVDLPIFDLNDETLAPLFNILRGNHIFSSNGDRMTRARDYCPFIKRGATAIAWDGGLSPCLPLMHTHTAYVDHGFERLTRRYVVGSITENNLNDLWMAPEYLSLRHRVQEFDFSPCSACGACGLAAENEEDCYGNTFPTCGGCLWAQGVIQCP